MTRTREAPASAWRVCLQLQEEGTDRSGAAEARGRGGGACWFPSPLAVAVAGESTRTAGADGTGRRHITHFTRRETETGTEMGWAAVSPLASRHVTVTAMPLPSFHPSNPRVLYGYWQCQVTDHCGTVRYQGVFELMIS